MKKAIEELNKKYNVDIYIERSRYDVYDHRGGYFTKFHDVINGTIVCVVKYKNDNLEDVLKELENKIIEALG